MKHGKVGSLAPNFLMRFFEGKTGCVQPATGGFFQRRAGLFSRFHGQSRKGIWRNLENVVRWMLLGFIIAGPSLSTLHSQDSRSARLADKNQPTTSLQLRSSKAPEPSARALDSGKASAPSRGEIVLPDIYIAVPNDTIATLKQQLEQAEQDLQQLQYEHRRLEKTLEQIQQRSFQGTRPPVQRTTGLRGRPSV